MRNTEKYNINQIAKSTNTSIGSAFKILKNLEKEKIVLSKKVGNAYFYTLNFENVETIKICELLLIQEKNNLEGYAKLYGNDIQNFKKAELIILFGSILKNKGFNDVDVLFMTKNVREVNKFCLDISKIRPKPIVPLLLQKKDLIKDLKAKKEVVLTIIKEGVVLKGESVFLEVIKNA